MSTRRIGPKRWAVALCIGDELEVPNLVGIDLTQPEAVSVGDEPPVGLGRSNVNRLPRNVLRRLRARYELGGGFDTSVRKNCFVEQPLLEACRPPSRGHPELDTLSLGAASGFLHCPQKHWIKLRENGIRRFEG